MASAKERYYANQAKKAKQKKAKKIDYSKRSKGQSKREYYAQKTGGKLDYKTGDITITKKVKKPSSSSSSSKVFQGPSLPGQVNPNYYNPYTEQVQTLTKSDYDTDIQSQREKASRVKKADGTQKSSPAGNFFNKITGIKTAQASGGTPSRVVTPTKKTGFGRALDILLDPLGIRPKARGIGFDVPQRPDFGVTESLGLEKYLSEPGGLSYNLGDQPGEYLSPTGEIQNILPSSPESPYYEDVDYTTGQPKQAPAPYASYDSYKSSQDREDTRRTPSPVSSPYVTPSSDISSAYQPDAQNVQDFSPQSQPTYGDTQNEQQGTVQRIAGKGNFSRGTYGNGAGDYGVDGTMGSPLEDEQSLLNKLLGIPTANAQGFDMPQQNMGISNKFLTPLGRSVWGTPQQSNFQPSYTQEPQTPSYTPPTPTGGAQAQPTGGFQEQTTGGSQQGGFQGVDYGKQQKQQEKMFKAQEKAQKKALEQLIKSITGQYDESRAEGTESLEKAKQQNLLRLSGLFGFANQDPNSEQRRQYEQRAETSSAEQLSDFLANLSRGQAQDISGAKQNYQGQLSNIASQRQSAMSQLQQAQQEQAMKMQQLMQQSQRGGTQSQGSGKVSHNDIFNFVNDAVMQGGTWQEIAEQAAAQGIDTSTGSYIDQLLNRQFRG